MRAVNSKARKQSLGLTVPQATREARRIVDQVMPGVGATVESRGSADPATLERVIVTTVTFPANHAATAKSLLPFRLSGLLGVMRMVDADSSITITRSVR